MSSEEIQQQLSQYSRFVDDVLRPQLTEATAAANLVRDEMADYDDLGKRLDSLLLSTLKQQSGDERDEKQRQQLRQKPLMKSMVDLGYGAVFCKAAVVVAHHATTPNIFVNVGMGFHVEMKIEDAREFVSKRLSFLRDCKLQEKEAKETEIMDHIESASIILNQLQAELRKTRR